jgi:hypothetical protein
MPHGTLPANLTPSYGDFAVDEAWQSITLQNGWVPYSTPQPVDAVNYNSPQVYRDSTGMIHLRGLISHPTGTGWNSGGMTLATLPYSSLQGLNFGVMWSGRVQNDATTNVVIEVVSNTLTIYINRTGVQPACPWLSLDGICFPDASVLTTAARAQFWGKVPANATPNIDQFWTQVADLSSTTDPNLVMAGGGTAVLYMDGEDMCHLIVHIGASANVQAAAKTIAVIPEAYRPSGIYMAPITRDVDFDGTNFGGETSRAEMNLQTGAMTTSSRWDAMLTWMPQTVIDNAVGATQPMTAIGSRNAAISYPNFDAAPFNPTPVLTPTYFNTWTQYGIGYEGGLYIPSNQLRQRCRLTGLMRVGTAGTVAFVSLPPAKTHIFLGLNGTSNGSGNGVPAEFRVNTSGNVTPTQASLWHCISGASYRTI